MNVLTIFDQRISAIFEECAPGERQPISFKRLAKRAVREMEDETFVIDGIDTAPALYTVLVSQPDDALMRPMYRRLCEETSQLIEAQAKKRGYTFVGRPLVRFMVDPALRKGRFSVFAENIDPRTLARLRDEESTYLGITPRQDLRMDQGFVPAPVPVHDDEPAPIAQEVAFAAQQAPVLDEPEPIVSSPVVPAPLSDALEALKMETLEPLEEIDEPLDVPDIDEPEPKIDPFKDIPQDYAKQIEQSVALEEEPEPAAPAPRHVARHAAASMAASQPEPEPASAPEPALPSCTLTNHASGQVYHVSNDRAPIGRERQTGAIVLTDPNASRRHAELTFDGSHWRVRDLNSTNGTLVNDMEVREAVLRDGDTLTIGLTSLEFRAD